MKLGCKNYRIAHFQTFLVLVDEVNRNIRINLTVLSDEITHSIDKIDRK